MLDFLSYGGMICLLTALVLNRKYLRLSDALNLIGSLSLTIWAVVFQTWAIFILDFVWSIISIIKLLKDLRTCR